MKVSLRTLEKGEEHYCGYPTFGDWQIFNYDRIEVTVSRADDVASEFAVMLHELIEAYLCRERGISETQVSEFDRLFEKERDTGKHSENAEPGDDPRAPYRNEHQAANIFEMLFLHMIGKSWPDHCNLVDKAMEK